MIGSIDYTKLINKVGSKYLLCVVAAKRAEQLIDNQVKLRQGKKPAYESELVDEIGKSPLYVALKEIEAGLVKPSFPAEKRDESQQFEITRLADEPIFPYEGELKVQKIINEFEQMLEEIRNYISTAEPEEEEVQQIRSEAVDLLDSRVTEAEESIEVLQEKELQEDESLNEEE